MAKRKSTERRGPGRPAVHGEPYTRVNVVLFNRQVAWLDHLAADVRGNTGQAVSRAEILRGILEAIVEAGPDLTMTATEDGIRRAVLSHFKRT